MIDFAKLDYRKLQQDCLTNLAIARNALAKIEKLAAQEKLTDTVAWQILETDFYLPLYHLQQSFCLINHLQAVMDNREMRTIQDKLQPQITAFYSTISQSKKFYKYINNVKLGKDFNQLSNEAQKVINNELRDFRLGGMQLSKNKQQQLTTIKQQLAKASNKFEQNVLDAKQSYSKLVSRNQLAGLPDDLLLQFKQANSSKYRLTLDAPCYLAIMQYATSRTLRQEIYQQYVTLASNMSKTKKYDNTTLISQILKLRKQKAQLLNFTSFAHLSLYNKMAKTPKQVLAFLYKLAHLSKNKAITDLNELTSFAKKHYGLTQLESWDIAFISEKLRQEKYSYSEHELKQYFLVPQVLNGLFKLIYDLYQAEFKLTSTLSTWHPDVNTYIVTQNKKTIGYLYLDLFVRPNKQSGAWMNTLEERFIGNDFSYLPLVTITCNFSNHPSQMLTFDDVQTIFHEMGHALHQLLSTVNHYTISGINNVEWDAVELPSQFMEYFLWDYSILKDISCHHTTKRELPLTLYKKMLAARFYLSGLQMLRQLEFSIIDMLLHCDARQGVSNQMRLKLIQQVRNKISVITPPTYNRMLNSFLHIFAGGYAAGYYSYKWAELLATDIFNTFAHDDQLDLDLGDKFYRCILANGSLTPMLTNFINFMGRKPKIAALLKYSGITKNCNYSAATTSK